MDYNIIQINRLLMNMKREYLFINVTEESRI